MAQYSMTLKNTTTNPWYFAIYQTFPDTSSIAWQVVPLPKQNPGTPPSSGTVNWTLNYGTFIADFDQVIGGSTGIEYANATLGNVYQVTSEDDIPTINPTSVGSAAEDQIILTNRTSPAIPITMGFTLCEKVLTSEHNVGGNESIIFQKSNTYYVAAHHDIKLRQLINEDASASIPPIAVIYGNGVFEHTVTIYEDPSGNTSLSSTF